MSEWLSNAKCQTLTWKFKEPKVEQPAAPQQVEDAEEEKVTFQANLHLAQLPALDALSHAALGHAKADEPDVSFLAQDFAPFDDFEEKDEAWDFKTLKNEIAHTVSRFYGGVKLPPFPAANSG